MRTLVEQSGRLGHVVAMAIAAVSVVAGASLWLGSRQGPPAVAPIRHAADRQGPAQPAAAAPRGEIGAYLAFVGSERSVARTTDHAYAAAGLRMLAAILVAEGRGTLWRARAVRLEEAADRIDDELRSHRHAGIAREAFLDLAEWIPELVRNGTATAASTPSHQELVEAAESIRPRVALLEQKPAVDLFFDRAAAALAPSTRT